jgi:transposase
MDKMAKSTHAAVRSLRQTYFSWRNEIANAILTKWSNGRTEGFNCKAKLVKREGYGFRNWENFRLKFWYSWALLAEEWAPRNRKIIGHLKKTRVSEP